MQEGEELNVRLLDDYEKHYTNYPSWVKKSFSEIVANSDIKYILHQALLETAGRNYINKHGREHGLTVAHNLLRLFELIDQDIVPSDYIQDFPASKEEPERKLEKSHVLFALLVAGYIHDVGRFYNPEIDHAEQVGDVVNMIPKLKEAGQIMQRVPDDLSREMMRRIKELCLCHDQKEAPSDTPEIALIKLADALDCTKARTYESEKPELKRLSYSEKIKMILFHDKYPEKYFGCYSVDNVTVDWDPNEAYIDIKLDVKDWAASMPVKSILSVLKLCEETRESVRKVSEAVRVWISEKPKGRKYLIYPRNTTTVPYVRILQAEYTIEILDKNGNGRVCMTSEIYNPRKRGNVRTQTFEFWGYKSTKWGKTAIVKMVNGRDNDELVPEYMESAERGKKHQWRVFFKELEPGAAMKLEGVYKWDNLVNLREDEFAYWTQTPCNELGIKIIFPADINPAQLEAESEISEMGGRGETPMYSTPCQPINDPETSRTSIVVQFHNLIPSVTYRVRWKIL